MTILSDVEIAEELAEGRLVIDPVPDLITQLQPASLDLRLGTRFSRFLSAHDVGAPGTTLPAIDTREGVPEGRMRSIGDLSVVQLPPGGFVLAHTVEQVRLPNNLVGVVDGRSSLGRLGVMVHITAGYIDPGFEGQITLEMHNVGPSAVLLHAGDRVCQIRFHRMSRDSAMPYQGKYQGDRGAVASRIELDKR